MKYPLNGNDGAVTEVTVPVMASIEYGMAFSKPDLHGFFCFVFGHILTSVSNRRIAELFKSVLISEESNS